MGALDNFAGNEDGIVDTLKSAYDDDIGSCLWELYSCIILFRYECCNSLWSNSCRYCASFVSVLWNICWFCHECRSLITTIIIIQKPCGRHHDLWHRSASRYLLLELGLYCQWTEIVLATRWSNFMKSTIKTIDWSYLKKSTVYFFTSIKSSTVPYQNIYIIFFKQNFSSKHFHYPLLLSLI